MELFLTVLAWIVGLIIGVPVVLIIAIVVLYAAMIFVLGLACIPIALVQRLCGKSTTKEDK